MPEPKVITGSINTSDYAEREIEFREEQTAETNLIALSAPAPGTYKKKVRNFESTLPSLRISVKHTYDRAAMDGTLIPGENESVKFKNYRFTTSNKAEIKAIETSTEWGVTVWDADIASKKSRESLAENMAKQMRENPELMAQVMNALKPKEGAENFEVPEKAEEEEPKEE